jgi:hypothetical protein
MSPATKEKGDHPLTETESLADVERFNWPRANEFEFDAVRELLLTFPDMAFGKVHLFVKDWTLTSSDLTFYLFVKCNVNTFQS